MADARKYTDEEVRAILDRALTKSATADGMSHEELLSIGEQVGSHATPCPAPPKGCTKSDCSKPRSAPLPLAAGAGSATTRRSSRS